MDGAGSVRPEAETVPGYVTFIKSPARQFLLWKPGCSAGEGLAFEVCESVVLGSPPQEQGCCNNEAELWLL